MGKKVSFTVNVYGEESAMDAWQRTLAHFRAHLV